MLHDTEGSSQMLATIIPWPIMSAVSHAWKLLEFNGCILVGICELTTNDDICVLDSPFQAVSVLVFFAWFCPVSTTHAPMTRVIMSLRLYTSCSIGK